MVIVMQNETNSDKFQGLKKLVDVTLRGFPVPGDPYSEAPWSEHH